MRIKQFTEANEAAVTLVTLYNDGFLTYENFKELMFGLVERFFNIAFISAALLEMKALFSKFENNPAEYSQLFDLESPGSFVLFF